MIKHRWFCWTMATFVATGALAARAAIVISTDEVWDGINNPQAAAGVTLTNGVYSIPTSVTINPGVTVYLQDPFTSNVSNNITWEFTGSGGLTFGDAASGIDVYIGDRNSGRTFTLNLNNNAIAGSVSGAGRIFNGLFAQGGQSGGSMGVTINAVGNVAVGEIDLTRNDAAAGPINITSQGTVNVGKMGTADVNDGGNDGRPINIAANAIVVGDIDTRSDRTAGSGAANGNISLRALGQPANSISNASANLAAVNSVTLKGLVRTNGLLPLNPGGNLNVTAVKMVLDSTFSTDLSELADFNASLGALGGGFTQASLLVNNSSVTPDSLTFGVYHDGVGPPEIAWSGANSGNWFTAGNWNLGNVPQLTNQTAVFGANITSAKSVYLDSQGVVKSLRFDTASKIALTGTASILLDADTGNASLDVLQGSHEIQLQLSLADNTTANVAAGSSLSLNGVVNLNGKTLNVTGPGQLVFNNLVTGAGSIVNSGLLALAKPTSFTGDLTNSGTLDFDLGGPAAYDSLTIAGTATLAGIVDLELVDGFVPRKGEAFTLVSASNLVNAGVALGGPDGSLFSLITTPTSLVAVAGDADLNGDGAVDGGDLAAWEASFGAAAAGDATGDGLATGLDLLFWQRNAGQASLGTSAIPEPTSGLLLGGALLAAVGRRRR
jgi:hypothetical protein